MLFLCFSVADNAFPSRRLEIHAGSIRIWYGHIAIIRWNKIARWLPVLLSCNASTRNMNYYTQEGESFVNMSAQNHCHMLDHD
jgi:hypothetical protein